MTREGYIEVPGGRVWYESRGQGGVPLLCLHGGPGFTHHYIDGLAALADRREVIFYDQLGCGRSDRPDDPSLWNVDRFVEEVVCVVDALDLSCQGFHLFGSSWGAMLAVQYVLDRHPRVAGLILSGGPMDISRYMRELQRLIAALPKEVQVSLQRHEAHGFFDCPEYLGATAVFLKKHFCRKSPWPECIERSFAEMGVACFREMQGPSETTFTGNLRDFNVFPRLREIALPTLVTCGRYDNVVPEHNRAVADLIPNARLVVFEHSGHMPFEEEAAEYMVTVNDFLDRAEGK